MGGADKLAKKEYFSNSNKQHLTKMNKLNLIFAFGLLLLGCQSSDEAAAPIEATEVSYDLDNTINLPESFEAAVVADSIGRARHITVRDNGDIYVQLFRPKNDRGLVALRDTNMDARADLIEYFGDHTGTGCGIYQNHLYAASGTEVFRYNFVDQQLLPDEDSKVLIAGGFPEQRSHRAKSFTFDNAGNIYINVGAPSNACMEEARTAGSAGLDPCPQLERQAGIWKFSADQLAQTQTTNGRLYATGIRNGMALDWNPNTDNLFALQHGRDQLSQFWPDLFTEDEGVEFPAEEFLSIEEGDDFGWPYCFFNQDVGEKKLAPEYGGDGKIMGRCADAKKPILAFPGHMAPNDLLFYTGDQFPDRYKNGAFIAFHGSWNRSPQDQKGYFVVFVPMENGQVSGDWEIFAEGFAGAGAIKSPRDAKHRPCGLAQGPDGSLYVSDDVKGKIWKIMYTS